MNTSFVINKAILIASFLAFALSGCTQKLPAVKQPTECRKQYPPLDTVITSHTEFTKMHYPKRIQFFMTDTLNEGDVIMLGNSLTEHGGNWAGKLGYSHVKNRGIKGDNTYGIMARLNEIICSRPSQVFLMIGTNDLWLPDSAERIAYNIMSIVDRLKESKNTIVYVQTIMPVEKGHQMSDKIKEVNNILRSLDSPDFILIDTNRAMANDDGILSIEYTTDGVHLTPIAYEKWSTILKSYLRND